MAFSGYVKGSVLLSWLPIDPLIIGLVTSLVGAAAFWLGPGPRRAKAELSYKPHFLPAVVVWLTFLPAIVSHDLTNGPSKVQLLFSVTLACAVLPAVLALSSESLQWVWLTCHAVAALVVLLGLVTTPDQTYVSTFGRLSIDGGSTIGASRVLAASMLIFSIVAVSTSSKRARLASGVWVAVGLIVLLSIGSRGPVLSLVAAIIVTLATSPAFRGRRLFTFAAAGMVIWGLLILVGPSGRGTARVLSIFGGDTIDGARQELYSAATRGTLDHPFGVGWGNFGNLLGGSPANDGTPLYPHNILLEVGVEAGWLALAALLYFGSAPCAA